MAEVIEEFDWNKARTTRSRYDWDQWFDGQVWRLKKDEDFTAEVASFRSSASTAAKKRDKTVRTALVDEDTVILQAFNGDS